MDLGAGPDGALVLVFTPGETDGFLAEGLGSQALDARLPVSLSWSSRDSVSVGAGAGFEIVIPLPGPWGRSSCCGARLALMAATDGATLEAALDAAFTLGPFAAWVQDVGVRGCVSAAVEGSLGAIDVTLALKPPLGVGFTIDVEGSSPAAASSATPRDRPLRRRARARRPRPSASSAITIIDTEPAGRPRRVALFASSALALPQPIPLGFGFTLIGVGGLLAPATAPRHRRAGARTSATGAADAILFPENPGRRRRAARST